MFVDLLSKFGQLGVLCSVTANDRYLTLLVTLLLLMTVLHTAGQSIRTGAESCRAAACYDCVVARQGQPREQSQYICTCASNA